MDCEEFLREEVPTEMPDQYQYLRRMENLINAIRGIRENANLMELHGEVDNTKIQAFQHDEDELSEKIDSLRSELEDVVGEMDLDSTDVDYKLREGFDSFQSQCRKLRDETLNKAFMEQFRELDNERIHKQDVVSDEDRQKLKKALFSCGTHCVIQREQGMDLDPVVEERVIKLLDELHHGKSEPQEVFETVREMFLLSARSERSVSERSVQG